MDRDRPSPDRLGLDVPHEWWPAPATLGAIAAAGFGWAQFFPPPTALLVDQRRVRRHAAAAREALAGSCLGAVVHAPFDLRAGSYEHDLAFDGLLGYAAEAGARYVVYHAGDLPADGGVPIQDRLSLEERALRGLARRAEEFDIVIALENLAPVHAGQPQRLSHSPRFVRELVQRVGSPACGMLLDVGHANIVAGLLHTDVARLVAPVLDAVCLFHVHDNLGGRLAGEGGPAFDPLRLDLHLPPGRGRLDWRSLGPLLAEHDAPLVLEVHPPHRPAPAALMGQLDRWLPRSPRPLAAAA